MDIVKTLKVDKLVNIVRFCESVNKALLVLPDAPGKIVCDTDVKGAILATRKNVDKEGLSISHGSI